MARSERPDSPPSRDRPLSDRTRVTTLGRDPQAQNGAVNPPVARASTILFPDTQTMADPKGHGLLSHYGRAGTQTTLALEQAVAALEGAAGCKLAPSGFAAVTLAVLSAVKAGDHILITDSAYDPTRTFALGLLKRFGVEAEFYDPLIGGDIAGLIRANTGAILVESPGSLSFEVQDIPAIVAVAKARGIATIADNTWATPLYFKPIEMGVNLSVQAATKYFGGHADVLLGTVAADAQWLPRVEETHRQLGLFASPDDAYLTLRGIRTLEVRLRAQAETAMTLARWFEARPEVERVLYPALESDPGHALWKRDFTGASGLFGVVLKPAERRRVDAMLNGMGLFGMGYSWGGFESLMIPTSPGKHRSATTWPYQGPCLRVHAGLEDPADLIADLDAGFARLRGEAA